MRYSRAFIPTVKEVPKEATMPSHVLMQRAGYARMVGAGIYELLPLGTRVLHKIEAIIREEMNSAGAQELFMPTFVPGDYFLVMWNPTGEPMDYTANIGFREDLFQGPADTPEKMAARARAETVTPMIERFKMNRMPCNQVPLN